MGNLRIRAQKRKKARQTVAILSVLCILAGTILSMNVDARAEEVNSSNGNAEVNSSSIVNEDENRMGLTLNGADEMPPLRENTNEIPGGGYR